ncbi:MAG: hypothetical protein KDD64_13010 [Bdellovibrionales bacterium]|nr:hypothetical protein [Bdellovibrionales bacterium]
MVIRGFFSRGSQTEAPVSQGPIAPETTSQSLNPSESDPFSQLRAPGSYSDRPASVDTKEGVALDLREGSLPSREQTAQIIDFPVRTLPASSPALEARVQKALDDLPTPLALFLKERFDLRQDGEVGLPENLRWLSESATEHAALRELRRSIVKKS